MNDTAIRVEGLGKQYRIGGKREPYKTLRDAVTNTFISPFRRAVDLLKGQAYGAAELDETFWALKDVSFEVRQGEVVGVIGRNGAGKSTLLKILSRITDPTEGYADVYGHVGALLEVGTGFHPELTGRENIYLNGAILGMARRDLDRKFDEIVAFSEIERFVDTPVKYFSSGMVLRLGFAVASYLEPEILIVDEILAVGDAAFQRKCLGRMGAVAKEGRTVLFVSHNMDAVISLTNRCIRLDNGHSVSDGPSEQVVMEYLNHLEETGKKGWVDLGSIKDAFHPDVQLQWIQMNDDQGKQSSHFLEQHSITVQMGFVVFRQLRSYRLAYSVDYVRYGKTIFTVATELLENLQPGSYILSLKMDPNYLRRGEYRLVIKSFINGIRQNNIEALFFTVLANAGDDSETLHRWMAGPIRLDYNFEITHQ